MKVISKEKCICEIHSTMTKFCEDFFYFNYSASINIKNWSLKTEKSHRNDLSTPVEKIHQIIPFSIN